MAYIQNIQYRKAKTIAMKAGDATDFHIGLDIFFLCKISSNSPAKPSKNKRFIHDVITVKRSHVTVI